jgi:hypothetical protein
VVDGPNISRRELLAAGAAAGVAIALPGSAVARSAHIFDFAAMPEGERWPGWSCTGVANMRVQGGRGLLEAGSDVFPCDPRPVAFLVDQRFRDGTITATADATGAGTGVVLRRVGPRTYYAAIVDDEQKALLLVRRLPSGVQELGRIPWTPGAGPVTLALRATGANPTTLTATAGIVTVSADDSERSLQRAGDPGVLATARTLFPSSGGPVPALGNLHLLPYGVQEGEAFMQTAVGQEILDQIRERSTAVFTRIVVDTAGPTHPTPPMVVAATNGAPLPRGGQVRVAADLPARVEIEYAANGHFKRSRIVRATRTGSFDALVAEVRGMQPGTRVWWRARLRRSGRTTIGPARSFKVLPEPGSSRRATIAIGACAAQFGPIFDHLLAQKPDVFVWQGDLNYPDTIGPLAQTMTGYAGIWRDFLANPRLAPSLEEALFAPQHDDHDYGVQDANSTTLVPWGIAPWNALMQPKLYYRFGAGVADFWVLDQRRFKSAPADPDTPAKTLLGNEQRDWLLRTLTASTAPFKVICSPCTLAGVGGNSRDGDWASGFEAERDLVLDHIKEHVSGQTLFVTGDTHWTMVYDRDGLFEARPCPLGIPTPNDITLTSPTAADDARKQPGVLYADQQYSHFGLVELSGDREAARLDLSLVREDGVVPFTKRFEALTEPNPRRRQEGRSRR